MPYVPPAPRKRRVKKTTTRRRILAGRDSALRAPHPTSNTASALRQIHGDGSYIGDVWDAVKSQILPAAGAALGAPFGSLGATFGRTAGQVLSKITGLGAYKVNKNSLVTEGQVPRMHASANMNEVRIRHQEYIQDVTSSTGFTNTVYSINPGLFQSFPWLSALAQNFQEYRFDGLVVCYKPTSGDAVSSTNNALGAVMICAEYNTLNAPFVNKQQMENSMWCSSAKPSEPQICPIECAPHFNAMAYQYIRTGAVPSGADQRMYDLCNVQVATQGMQAASIDVGELWLSYDIVLAKPIVNAAPGNTLLNAHYVSNDGTVSTSAYFGAVQQKLFDSVGITFSTNSVTMPAGYSGTWAFMHYYFGGAVAGSRPAYTYTNGTNLNILLGQGYVPHNDTVDSQTVTTGTSVTMMTFQVFTINSPTAATVIHLAGGTLPSATVGTEWILFQLNGQLA